MLRVDGMTGIPCGDSGDDAAGETVNQHGKDRVHRVEGVQVNLVALEPNIRQLSLGEPTPVEQEEQTPAVSALERCTRRIGC